MKKYTFHVSGMHCDSCSALIESELGDIREITSAKASLTKRTVSITGDFEGKEPEQIAAALGDVLKSHGYDLSLDRKDDHAGASNAAKWSEFKVALPVAVAFIAFFIILQKLGIVNLITSSNVGYGTAFLIGLVASVSTCMAVVGGLVLSMSASYAQKNDNVRPQIFFHVGRLVSFFVLGGAIGALGSVFQLGGTGTFVLGILVAIVLLILGVNLLDIFPWARALQPTLPKFLGKNVHRIKKANHVLAPVLLGVATFFLPCGFTQSMQIFALSTGSFWTGAMTMFVFALGTLPVLAILSFGSLSIGNKVRSGVFFKSAGLVVLFFGAFNLLNSLAAVGLIPPLFNF